MDGTWPLGPDASLLGAYHGLNPAMGWLFAVALGMQERRRAAVLRALAPIALGHELAIVRRRGARRSGSALLADTAALHLGAGGRADRLRDLPLRQAARAPALDRRCASTARELTLVVVPHVQRPRRRADGRAGADRRGRGGEAGASDHALAAVAQRRDVAARERRSRSLLHVGAMLAVMARRRGGRLRALGVAILRKAWLNIDSVWAARSSSPGC